MDYPIYLDFNATTPVHEQVLAEMIPYMSTHFGNSASSYHAFGWKASEAVSHAREKIANFLNCAPNEIVFTSGATESINLAIKGVFEANKHKGNHIITVKTEHKAVIDTCYFLEKNGARITFLDVDTNGNIALEVLEKAICKDTILISIMAANNETGSIHQINQLGEIAQKKGVIFHTDASQAIGKIPLDLTNIDLLCFSGHKVYGPKGVGALFISKNCPIIAQQHGGQHERNLRSGTLNIPAIVGLGKAIEIAANNIDNQTISLSKLRDKLEQNLLQNLPEAFVNGNTQSRLPNTTNICFGEIDGEYLLLKLNEIAVSNGSACNSASTQPSHVLKAMGISDSNAFSSIRFSLGNTTTEKDIDFAIEHIINVVNAILNERN
jgi:cysteine desulfurase